MDLKTSFAIGAACVLFGCDASATPAINRTRDAGESQVAMPAPVDAGPQRPGFCDREGADQVRDKFCGDQPPQIGSLHDLQELLSIVPAAPNGNGVNIPLLIGHSTALAGHLVSPINPRAIVIGNNTVSAFQRGAQRIELASLIRSPERQFNFYLLSFEQACNARPEGCSPADLYSLQAESGWTNIEIRDAEELKNTPSDCRQCHQRGREEPVLLMRELEAPWTHFFEPDDDVPSTGMLPGVRGRDLMKDYLRAKGSEPYAGVDALGYGQIVTFTLQNLVGRTQPLLFDSPGIEDERWPRGDNGYAAAPAPSPIWERGYEAFKRGEQLALPYVEPRVSDETKQAQLTAAYRAYAAGERDELPDMADIFSDDPLTRARIGLQTEPDATPAEALIQACGSCHNDVLDQTISRARFNVQLSRLDHAELDSAIERIERPRTAIGAMPPPEARQLDGDVRARLIEFLRHEARDGVDDPQLEHAATVGMSGGGGSER